MFFFISKAKYRKVFISAHLLWNLVIFDLMKETAVPLIKFLYCKVLSFHRIIDADP